MKMSVYVSKILILIIATNHTEKYVIYDAVKYSIIGKKQRREEKLRRIEIIKLEPEWDTVEQVLGKPKASLSPTLFLPITMSQPQSKPTATSTWNNIAPSNMMRHSRSNGNPQTVDGLDEGNRRLCQLSPPWSSPSSRHFTNSQFSLDRTFDDDLLDLLSKSISSSDLARNRIPNCSTDMEECLFLSMSVTPVPNSPISAFYGSPCNTPPLIDSPSRISTFDGRTPSISVRRNVYDSSEEQRALSIALANRLSELFNGDEENDDTTHYSYRSGVNSAQHALFDDIFHKENGDELIGDRKVRFRELDDVRVIDTISSSARTTGESTPLYSPFEALPYDLSNKFPSAQGDSSSFLDDSEICLVTRRPAMTSAVDSTTRPLNLNGERPSYYCADRDSYRDRVGSNYSSMDTLDCNDLITIISIINESDTSCNCKEKENDTDISTNINIDNRSHAHQDDNHEFHGKEDLNQISILSRNERGG